MAWIVQWQAQMAGVMLRIKCQTMRVMRSDLRFTIDVATNDRASAIIRYSRV